MKYDVYWTNVYLSSLEKKEGLKISMNQNWWILFMKEAENLAARKTMPCQIQDTTKQIETRSSKKNS